jgi:hypothetical protein
VTSGHPSDGTQILIGRAQSECIPGRDRQLERIVQNLSGLGKVTALLVDLGGAVEHDGLAGRVADRRGQGPGNPVPAEGTVPFGAAPPGTAGEPRRVQRFTLRPHPHRRLVGAPVELARTRKVAQLLDVGPQVEHRFGERAAIVELSSPEHRLPVRSLTVVRELFPELPPDAVDLVIEGLPIGREVVVEDRAHDASDQEPAGDPAVHLFVLLVSLDVLEDRPGGKAIQSTLGDEDAFGPPLHVAVHQDGRALSCYEKQLGRSLAGQAGAGRLPVHYHEPGPQSVAAQRDRAGATADGRVQHRMTSLAIARVEESRDALRPRRTQRLDRELPTGLVGNEVQDDVAVDQR